VPITLPPSASLAPVPVELAEGAEAPKAVSGEQYTDLLERLRDHVSAYLRDGTKTEADLRAHLIKDEHWPDPGLSIVRSNHGLYLDLKP
jgi:hypothetical protein